MALLLLGSPVSGWAQTRFFVEAPDFKEATRAEKNVSTYRVYRLDVAALRSYLANAPVEFTADSRPVLRLSVPLPNGTTETFAIYDSPVLAPVVAAQYPNIKTYTGQTQTAGSTAVIRFSFTDDEFNAIVLGLPGAGTVYFQKLVSAPAANVYLSYSTLDVLPATGIRAAKKKPCGVQPPSRPINVGGANRAAAVGLSTGGTLRTLRLAITATGEFTNAKGTPNNTAAGGGYAAVVQYVNRMVAVYRRELSVSFVLVSTASVVYPDPDPATDPFLTPTNNSTVLPVSQSVLDTNVGDANYDIGHTLGYGGASSGGGLAQGSSVCSTGSKAQAVSDVNEGGPGAFPAVFGDQVFCHEVGYQVGMNHSYNSSIPVCTTRNPDTSVEPGAGTTIMSYGYTCADAVDPAKNDDYETGYLPFLNFHAVNLAEATTFLGTISCFTTTNTGNAVPVITAFTTGRTIPKSTPFALTGTATDANAGNVLSYSWEGLDTGAPAATPPGSTVLADAAQAPFFRSYEPAATITHMFPRLASILNGTNQAKGDKLPSVSRVVNLRLTVRDNVDGANEASSAITIDGNSSPFLITSNLAGSYPGNTSQTVTWSVNNTTAAPQSAAFAYPVSSASYCSGAAGSLMPALGAGAVAGTFTIVSGTSTGATINPTTGAVNVSAATAGTFIVRNTLAASGGCAAVVATQTLTVLPLPATPVLIAAGTNTVAVQGGAVAGLSYQFRRNGVAVGTASATASYQVMSAAGSGQYTVVATSAAGCSSASSAAVTVAFITSTIAQAAPVTLLLYPNPAPLGGGATVELRGWTGGLATLTLYDVLGRTMRVTPAASGGTTHLDLSGMAAGVYLLRAQALGQQAMRRL